MNEIFGGLDNVVSSLIIIACFIAFIPAMLVVGFKSFMSYVKFTSFILAAVIVIVPSVFVIKWFVDKEEAKYELKVEKPIPKAIIVNEK